VKVVERKLNKAQIATIWLLIISVLLTAGIITVVAIANYQKKNQTGTSSGGSSLDLKPGESTYLNQRVVYPSIEESEILFLEISNSDGKFGVSRYPDENGSFLFHYYVDGEEQAIPYTPPIVGAEGSFDYTSLYAVETGDGYGKIYYLTYLCVALSAPFFTERIELPSADTPEGKEKRDALLKDYGLTQKDSTMISFQYCEKDPTTKEVVEGSEDVHVIMLGGKALSGTGYYFMVDDRNYVYYTNSEYFNYAMRGFASFIKGTLVSAGLDQDSVYGPYLTTDFKSWTGTMFEKESDRVFTNDMDGYKKYENPTVIVNGDYKKSIDKGLDYVPEGEAFSGYEIGEKTDLKFDLEVLRSHPSYTRIKNTFVGKNVGTQAEKIVLTLLDDVHTADEKLIDFGEADSVTYEYSVSEIEAVLADSGERISGTVGADDTLLKVTYRYTVGGKTVAHDCHAVIDLANLTDSEKAKFVGKVVGTPLGADAFTFTVNYTKDEGGSFKSNEKYVLTEILSIFNEKGEIINAVTENAYVNISYRIDIDKNKGTTKTTMVLLSDIKDDSKLAALKNILIGKEKGVCNEVVYNDEYRYEFMREFATYEISEIKYFIANEIIASFAFCNASERDPFYGDTFYKNTLQNEYSLYGLNSGTCESAVKLLGGIGSDSNHALGLSGETVAIGLTLEHMKDYDLYAHKIYFEMPRNIYDATEDPESANNDAFSDYAWLSTLGFNLYISDATYDENGNRIRYIGSDMYDIIAKVPAADFDFVEYSFVEFWARKNMVVMNVEKLDQVKLEFNMEEYQGEYTFDLTFQTAYGAYIDGKYVVSEEKIDGYSPFDYQKVYVKASDDAFDSAFKDMFGTGEWGDLATLYDHTLGDGDLTFYPGSDTTLGAAYFNSLYESLQFTAYLDELTEEEQTIGKTKPKVLSMQLKVAEKAYYYKYDFYRIDDRRVMVSLYRTDDNGNKIEQLGEVSDFYISTFAFKKIVNNYLHLLDGKVVDETISYPD
jgi:hypothetical protein